MFWCGSKDGEELFISQLVGVFLGGTTIEDVFVFKSE